MSKQKILDGFLASLSSRRLELRSALGSFATVRNFPLHGWSRIEAADHYVNSHLRARLARNRPGALPGASPPKKRWNARCEAGPPGR